MKTDQHPLPLLRRSSELPFRICIIALLTTWSGLFTTNDCLYAGQEPAQDAIAAPAQPPIESPAADYMRLAASEVAASLGLTEEQAASVQQVLTEHQTALTTADDTTRPSIVASTNDKLKSLLTQDQQRLFVSLFTDKKLRFNFRSQKWADVLDWMAKEADLSLVMETPPPGTFNYSDRKDYSTTEAIDLLNGWLLTKGFTLVRRERMLMCLDLKSGLPEGAIPSIQPTELVTRGRYEFVSVLFPLESRPAEAVLMEIKPLLGTYGKAEALPQTQQILVIDTATNLKVIEQIVRRIPVPAPGPAVTSPPAAVLTVYPIIHANPTQAGEVLKQILAGSTVVVDAKASQISVNAIPSEQVKAKSIIDQLEQNQGPDVQPVVKLYPALVTDADQLLATLKLIAPGGQFRIDPVSGNVVAWAPPADQIHIEETIKTIMASQPAGNVRQMQVYALKNLEPTAVYTMIATVVPSARVTINTTTKSLIVMGSQSDQEAVARLIAQLEEQTDVGTAQKDLKAYPVSPLTLTTAVTLMATAIPQAQVVADAPGQRILVLANSADQARAEILLNSLATAEVSGRTLKMYEADRIDTTSVVALLTTVVPQASVTVDAVNRRLLIVAAEQDHKSVTDVLEQVKLSEDDAQRTVKSHPLQPRVSSTTIVTLAASLAPRASVAVDEANRRLLVTGTDRDHALIDQIIEQVQNDSAGILPELRFYPLQKATSTTAVALLQTIVPTARVTVQPEANRLNIVATPDEHQKVTETLQLLETGTEQTQKSLEFFSVGSIGAADTRTLLATTFTDVTFVATADGSKLMAWVTASQSARIQELLEKLTVERPFDSATSLKFYSIRDLGASATTVLTRAVPKATITPGATADQVAVVASEEDHAKFAEVLAQLESQKEVTSDRTLEVFSIRGTTPAAVLQVLQPLVDTSVQLTIDTVGQQLFVRATAEKHEQIRPVVQQVLASLEEKNRRSTKTYVVGAPNADEAQEVLLALFPDAKIVTDADRKIVIATATDEQHVTIDQITSQMKGAELDGDLPVSAIYTLRNASATELQTLLTSMYSRFDNVRLTVNEKTGRLIVLARPEQQTSIRELIEKFDSDPVDKAKKELAVFRLNQIDGLSLQQALQPLLPPNAQVTADRIGRQLFVSAETEDMPAIRELVQTMMSSSATSEGLITRIYKVRPFEADEAQEVLMRLFPDATLVTDVSQEILTATATETQHATIKDVVEQMVSQTSDENSPQPRVYPLRFADGENLVLTLGTLFNRSDNVRASFDSNTGSLLVVARPTQHAIVQKLIEDIEPTSTQNSARTLEIYSLQATEGKTATQVAEGMLKGIDPAATVSWDPNSRQLIVTTTPAGHAEVKRGVERFQEADPREMDVLQLRTLSPSSAQNAIEGLYGDSFSDEGSYPIIQADEDSQQLLLRGTKKQLQEIRTLLRKMGETQIAELGGVDEPVRRNLRVIQIEGDIEPQLRRIEDLWPRVRRNSIRILRPGSNQQSPRLPATDNGGQFSIPAEDLNASQETSTQQDAAAEQGISEQQKTVTDESPPVIMIPGNGQITIVSDDLDALDQLEAMLRATQSGTGATRSRDFSVFQLRNAGAEDVVQTLKSVFESRAGLLAFGSVVLVPETRINAVIVYGGRTDRDRVEQLLEILDAENLPDSGRIFRTQVIPIRHADAEDIEDVIQGVYRTEMSAGGSRRAIEIPPGVDSNVASVLRQINAAASSPLLTIEVQRETNSLIAKAPQNLIDELAELIEQLDTASEASRARSVSIIPLRKTNSRRVMRILDNVLDD
ncbi:MAG: hypothetical protein JNL58_19120 [Planctomyces sp.]|nr:hypothetical protein [Planctomyces sp.]